MAYIIYLEQQILKEAESFFQKDYRHRNNFQLTGDSVIKKKNKKKPQPLANRFLAFIMKKQKVQFWC